MDHCLRTLTLLLGGAIALSGAYFGDPISTQLPIWSLTSIGIGLLIMFVGIHSGTFWFDAMEIMALVLLYLGCFFHNLPLGISSLVLAIFAAILAILTDREVIHTANTPLS